MSEANHSHKSFKPHVYSQLGYSNKVNCLTCKQIKEAVGIHSLYKQTKILPNTNDLTLNQLINDYLYW